MRFPFFCYSWDQGEGIAFYLLACLDDDEFVGWLNAICVSCVVVARFLPAALAAVAIRIAAVPFFFYLLLLTYES